MMHSYLKMKYSILDVGFVYTLIKNCLVEGNIK